MSLGNDRHPAPVKQSAIETIGRGRYPFVWLQTDRAAKRVQQASAIALMALLLGACDRADELPSCGDASMAGETLSFVSSESGVTVDSETGANWYVCNAGQRFYKGRCTGTPVRASLADAQGFAKDFSSATGSSWRLPTSDEMRSLVEDKCANPVISPHVFPGIEVANYWTSSPSRWGDSFGCALNTFNGSHFCGHSSLQQMPFLLIKDTK